MRHRCCYTCVVTAAFHLNESKFRQSYTLSHSNIVRLAVLACWENRTASQQVDQLIYQGFIAYRDSLDSERRAALDAEFTEHMEGA